MVDSAKLRKLLEKVAEGEVLPEAAVESLRNLPFEDLGFAKVDHHRQLRKGFPETIFASGKTPEQVITIIEHMRQHGSNVLATRCDADMASKVVAAHGDVTYHEVARCLTLTMDAPDQLEGYIAIVCAGTSEKYAIPDDHCCDAKVREANPSSTTEVGHILRMAKDPARIQHHLFL